MRAVVLREFGPAENLSYETVPDPTPGSGEVGISVDVVGVHLVDTMMRAGYADGPPLPELPAVWGSEVAGVVESVGKNVPDSWVGSPVVVVGVRPGGYAERAVADETALVRIPEGLDPQTAVAMVRTGATTLGVVEIGGLEPDDVVLVNSAAGGIGRLLIPYAKSVGAKVIGAAGGPEKVAAVEDLGADLAVDYRRPDWPDEVRNSLDGNGITVVFDGVGGREAEGAYGLLNGTGRFVSYGDASQQARRLGGPGQPRVIDALTELLSRPDGFTALAQRALAAAADGTFVPTVRAFPLSEAAAVHRKIETRDTTGKVVLIP